MSKVLVFSRINYFNFLLCYVLSFFWEIKTFQFQNVRIRKGLKKISLYDWDEHCDFEEGSQYFFQESVKSYVKKFRLKNSDNAFVASIDGEGINVSQKIKKDLCPEFSHYHMFQRYSHNDEVYIQGIALYFLKKYADYPIEKEQKFSLRLIGYVNILMEHVGYQLYYLLRQMFRMKLCIQAIFNRTQFPQQKFKIIWNAVASPEELSFNNNGLNCFWILENTNLKKEEILFILPRSSDKKNEVHLKHSQITYIHFPIELIQSLSLKKQLSIILFSMKIILELSMGIFKLSLVNRINANKLQLLVWKHVVPHFRIETYVNSVSDALLGSYDVILLNQLSVNTVLYHYSANGFPKSLKGKINPFHMSYSTFLHKYITVWHQGYAKDIHTTYDQSVNIKVTGPVLAAKENFKKEELVLARKKYFGNNHHKLFLISVFDIPPQNTKSGTGLASHVGTAISEEYYSEFIRDIDRLMNEIPEIAILYKPKRDFTLGNLSAPEGFDEVVKKNQNNPRWVTLNNEGNPWFLVSISDLVISIPFTSSSLISLNKGKPFLFHNPSHYFTSAFYEELDDYITKSYEELAGQVRSIKDYGMDFNELIKSTFYVSEPKGGYTQGLVDFLRNPKEECTPKSDYINSKFCVR
jgi:polysaccharide biosynthesis PFTS motif protein